MKRLIAILLLCLLLWGCGATNSLGYHGVVKFSDMAYIRPDLEALRDLGERCCETARTSTDIDAVEEAIWEVYDAYDAFSTAYSLADIHYQADLSDIYWQEESNFCSANLAAVDALLEELYMALAQSPLRQTLDGDDFFGPGFLEAYEGDGLYDDTFIAMLEQEQDLIAQYYALSDGAADLEYYSEASFAALFDPLTELLARLTALRQDIAAYAGFDSYTDFAYAYTYGRDYTPVQAAAYLDRIRTDLVPLYSRCNVPERWAAGNERCGEGEVFSHVEQAAKAMGGVTEEAFRLLKAGELYDIGMGEHKSGISFEVYLENYYEPYVFLSGTGTAYDRLTFAHEFGHFATDYAAAGSYAGSDVLEIFSQGMEYLSLCYGGGDLTELKLIDSLATYVEQAAYAEFEHRLYSLESPTAGEIAGIYEEVCRSYGFGAGDWDPRDLVLMPHFYVQPLYIISYVVSNDAAMQLYELEQQTPGAGRDRFEAHLATEETALLAFLEAADLESPFTRVEAVKALFEGYFEG